MRGEACIVHLLEAFEVQELSACHLVDGALILRGTAVNQDGRSSSLTVRCCCTFALAHAWMFQCGGMQVLLSRGAGMIMAKLAQECKGNL